MPRHEARSVLTYTPEQLFDLAADVADYPDFLPWWYAARVCRRDGAVYYSDQVIGFGVFRQRFRSRTVLQRPKQIVVTSTDKAFRTFELVWLFDPQPDGGCQVSLVADLELRSRLVQDLFARTIARSVGSIMAAFGARADQLYGGATAAGPATAE